MQIQIATTREPEQKPRRKPHKDKQGPVEKENHHHPDALTKLEGETDITPFADHNRRTVLIHIASEVGLTTL